MHIYPPSDHLLSLSLHTHTHTHTHTQTVNLNAHYAHPRTVNFGLAGISRRRRRRRRRWGRCPLTHIGGIWVEPAPSTPPHLAIIEACERWRRRRWRRRRQQRRQRRFSPPRALCEPLLACRQDYLPTNGRAHRQDAYAREHCAREDKFLPCTPCTVCTHEAVHKQSVG